MDKLFDRLQMLADRYEELGELLSDPDVIADSKRFMELSKEMADLRETVEKYEKYKQVVQQIKDDEEMLSAGLDDEMAAMVKEELSDSKMKSRNLNKRSKFCFCQKTLTMAKTLSWRFAVLPAGMKQVCLLQICFRCTANMPNGKDGRLKSLTRI